MDKSQRKRVVVVSDFHCGHVYGLTPPAWWLSEEETTKSKEKIRKFQRELWNFYKKSIECLKPIDVLVVNGDTIEGKDVRSGGIELLTTDRHEQVRMAKVVIDEAEAATVRLTYGTGYHVGKEEDFESILCDIIECKDKKIEGHSFLEVNGRILDIKHKVSTSSVPHGRMTAISRAQLWNTIWNAAGSRQPLSTILIRSHVHYHIFCGDSTTLRVITPALTYNSSYGIRECEGLVDVGLIYFDFEQDGYYTWDSILADFGAMRVAAESV